MHIPVLRERCLELLGPALRSDEALMVDATVGLGGHAEAFLSSFPELRLVGLDRDPEALDCSRKRLASFGDRVRLIRGKHCDLAEVLSREGIVRVDAFLFDLGVSSLQIDSPHRGFAYSFDTRLDMRMDPSDSMTAADVVNEYPEPDLTRILRTYGEERHARRIARAIVAARADRAILDTVRLVEIIREALPAAAKRTGGNPAKRTFQAIRIEVNGELAGLPGAIDTAVAALVVGGRIAVLSYQSLEDKIVKRRLVAGAQVAAPPGFPVIPDDARPSLRLLTRGAEVASDREIADNPRATSVRLRAAERIREAA